MKITVQLLAVHVSTKYSKKYSTNCCWLAYRIKLQPTQGTEEQEQ